MGARVAMGARLLATEGARRLGWSSDDLPPSPIVYRRQARATAPPPLATTNHHHHGAQLLPTTASFTCDELAGLRQNQSRRTALCSFFFLFFLTYNLV
ncbi:hypothetical protein TIFTF001_020558 [Ficus carica]|uniref:Uncharacterized protein n=1 Tax=Ficus carica TaxID=3494 RepID=A0AA88AU61_FICCA|nr:hypothetical protein TIFTF001_020558 [Ficus carica]